MLPFQYTSYIDSVEFAMSSADEEKFTVTDRRPRFDEESGSSPSPSSEGTDWREKSSVPPGPVSFSGFILSLGTSALIHLGEENDPLASKKEVKLERAREVIDLLSMLEVKTKGNLSSEEENLVTHLLYTLRMKYMQAEKRSR